MALDYARQGRQGKVGRAGQGRAGQDKTRCGDIELHKMTQYGTANAPNIV